jgi:hypothetical protein
MGVGGQHHALDYLWEGDLPVVQVLVLTLMQLMIARIITIVSEVSRALGCDTTLLDGWFEVF